MNNNLKFNFNNREEDGYWTECQYCKGSGKGKDGRECIFCHGKAKYHHLYRCHHNINVNCCGGQCNMWDHDNGGGCLQRKLILKQIYGMVIK